MGSKRYATGSKLYVSSRDRKEAIEKKLFGTGTPHKEFRGMLGDYLAIATGNLSIFFNEERWKSMHGSVTEDEVLIPLIVFE